MLQTHFPATTYSCATVPVLHLPSQAELEINTAQNLGKNSIQQ